MSDAQNSKNNEEIDLGQLLQLLGNFLKKVLVGFFDLMHFFKRKAFILIGVVVLGIAGGMALDHFFPKKSYVQEIIIEPNYESTAFIYDFVEQFNQNLELENFGLDLPFGTQLELLFEVSIEPVVDYSDVLNFYKDLESNDSSYDILEDISGNMIGNEKYRNHFRFHKLRFYFSNDLKGSMGFSKSFLAYLKSNTYFIEKQKIKLQELTENIEENEKSVKFINDYITKISKNKGIKTDNIVVVGSEKEIPTLASLINQKNSLIEKISIDKEILQMGLVLFNEVKIGSLLEDKDLVNNRKELLPLLLLGCFLAFYLLKFLYNKSNIFINN